MLMCGFLASASFDGAGWLDALPLFYWLAAAFVVGAALGSFLNVCIYRLPLEKSIVWPSRSFCGHCLQPVLWYDNIPLVSYWLLGGRCRVCRTPFSVRYFFVELLTALGLMGLFYLEVDRNVHHLDPLVLGQYRFDIGRLAIFGFHAALFCFLMVATFCDFDHQVIPLPLTIAGALIGLIGACLFPWPWPYAPGEASSTQPFFAHRNFQLVAGLYPWPVWGPLPELLRPGGNWQTGLATGLAGTFCGTLMLRAVRFLFGLGMGAAYMEPETIDDEAAPAWFGKRWLSWLQRVGGRALGLGDADLMMMAGAFIGWQPVLVAFLVGVLPGLILGVVQVALKGNTTLPFGPALALGVMITILAWSRLGPYFQPLFFDKTLILTMGGICVFLMLVAGYLIRLSRMLR